VERQHLPISSNIPTRRGMTSKQKSHRQTLTLKDYRPRVGEAGAGILKLLLFLQEICQALKGSINSPLASPGAISAQYKLEINAGRPARLRKGNFRADAAGNIIEAIPPRCLFAL